MKLYGIKDAGNVLVQDIITGASLAYIDYANSCSINITGSTVYGKAKGSNRISAKGDTTATMEMSVDIIDSAVMAMMLGSEILTTNANVSGRQQAVVTGGKVSLTDTPIANSVSVMLAEGDRTFFTVGGTVSPTNVTVSGKDITFDSTLNGKKVIVFYLKAGTNNKSFRVNVNNSSKAYKMTLVADAILDADSSKTPIELVLLKVKPKESAGFEFTADKFSTFKLSFDLLQDGVGDILSYTEL